MGTDGDGVTTLIAFYGCPLKCRYCLNLECHNSSKNPALTSLDLYNRIKIDRLYFLATGGGLTFGGGEPLLNALFIKEVLMLGASEWHTTIETSLNVPFEKWECIVDSIDEFIIDIKDMNSKIYKEYTACDNLHVVNNLKELAKRGLNNRTIIRLPLIKGFNDQKDIMNSLEILEKLGFARYDRFTYSTDVWTEKQSVKF